ncbi:MAG: hypothetical protein A3C07_01265 [Candidatus Sungbacteria bacterium RIFCSPHIGHO2_02_FULL_47_11]|uniref:Uncharacterized protein n=1 Tax=Candidatus Sungbacteria bacterium RIFCSPHIGHO2_02_FULL_47_11 TaxID=1802270 RepID=A0A1G2KLZ4_9BACT|nr:MAG: hypothetical protein A3C07_01265 [Candidatus Sungbacteria bacterium RIFCSPHIGHO2_02_FULL_47_11]
MSNSLKSALYRLVPAGVILFPFAVLAQTDKLSPVAQNLLTALNIVVTIVFVLAVVVFGWGIVQLIIAAGDPAKIKQARQFIVWGVIGIAILASIFGIIQFIQNYIGVTAGTGPIRPPGVTPPVSL